MRVAAVVSEAFGGHGGIACFNRDLLTALCELPQCRGVTAIPRLLRAEPGPLPEGLEFRAGAARGAAAYLREWLSLLGDPRGYDLVICGHINLLPLAEPVRRRFGAPLVLFIYGIDAWRPTGRALTDWLAKRVDGLVSISELTLGRFRRWAGDRADSFLLPNAIRPEDYGPGDKPAYLVERYRLRGRRVLLTLGRLSAAERYKGIDEVLDLLPRLREAVPDLHYLVIGEGDDRPRLASKAQGLGVGQRVTFGGAIAEAEKADHYRLADAFVMAGRGEGFGFVFLEAMACGVPVVASIRDGSREAVRDGQLGLLADPDDPESLYCGILKALGQPRRVPQGLDYFAYPRFRERLAQVVTAIRPAGAEQA